MGRKHWEKEKLLVTSNCSFSHSVFKRLVSQGRQKVSLCGNGLIVNLQRIPQVLMTLGKQPLKTSLEKKKMLVSSIFSQQCFQKLSSKRLLKGRILWERINPLLNIIVTQGPLQTVQIEETVCLFAVLRRINSISII